MLEILNNLTHLDQSQTLITVMSSSFYFEGFSLGHVIITMIIMALMTNGCPIAVIKSRMYIIGLMA